MASTHTLHSHSSQQTPVAPRSKQDTMSSAVEHIDSMQQLPVIVVTPALPSRNSLPTDMRYALDSVSDRGHT